MSRKARETEKVPAPWGRRVAKMLVGLLALAAAIPIFAAIYMRHVPYSIKASAKGGTSSSSAGAELPAEGGLSVRYLGVTGYEISDGQTVIITDPMLTRPTILDIQRGPLVPNTALSKRLVPRADYILINHAHYDHSIDMPEIARRTGAIVVGSQSACNLAISRGHPAERVRVVKGGEQLTLGTFTIDVGKTRHSAIGPIKEPMKGTIPADAGPLWWFQYVQDGTLCFRLEANGTSLWFHPASTFREGELGGRTAQNLIIGINGEPMTETIGRMALEQCRPRLVIPTHFDNFFQPREKGLALFPGLGLEQAHRALTQLEPTPEFRLLDYDEVIHLPPDGADAKPGRAGQTPGEKAAKTPGKKP